MRGGSRISKSPLPRVIFAIILMLLLGFDVNLCHLTKQNLSSQYLHAILFFWGWGKGVIISPNQNVGVDGPPRAPVFVGIKDITGIHGGCSPAPPPAVLPRFDPPPSHL
jgi:hypothetical protein